jgi:hypothetical protein
LFVEMRSWFLRCESRHMSEVVSFYICREMGMKRRRE